MDVKVNGVRDHKLEVATMTNVNGHAHAGPSSVTIEDEAALEELEAELPVVFDGQIEMRELLSRMVQAIYAELTEMAETLPGMSDGARKRTIADWVVKTKKQVVKLYAVVRWARDASDVQKAMNVTAFLLDQNQQFEDVMNSINAARESLAPARLRNHDILTSLDVLTTGSYLRLPSQIKKFFIFPPRLDDEEVKKTLVTMESHIRYRLRMREIIPPEMSKFRIEDGRVFFTVPELFETSLTLRGVQRDDPWLFLHVEFLHGVAEDGSELQEFPKKPQGIPRRHISDEANGRLTYYLQPKPADPNAPLDLETAPPNQLPSNTIDVPLIRLFNFLRKMIKQRDTILVTELGAEMMSLTYQLEILFHQALRLRSLGWANCMGLERSRDGKSFKAMYWVRQANKAATRQQAQRNKIPPFGGTLTVSLEQTFGQEKTGGGPLRSSRDRILSSLERRGKINEKSLSDELETYHLVVKWEPMKGAFGVTLPPELEKVDVDVLRINARRLDFELLVRTVIRKHIRGILLIYERTLLHGIWSRMFYPGEVSIVQEDAFEILKVHMCADEYLTVSFDERTGRLSVKDKGGLSASAKSRRYVNYSNGINENPTRIFDVIRACRFNSIIDSADQKAQYMGLQTFKERNLSREEYAKFGNSVRALLFIQLANFPMYYLVFIVTEAEFRFALVSTRTIPDHPTNALVLDDIGWLDYRRIHSEDLTLKNAGDVEGPAASNSYGGFGSFDSAFGLNRFKLETETLRELYAYCCARVAYTKVELQLKAQAIPYSYLPLSTDTNADLQYMQSSLVRSVPGLCVQSSKILERAPAAEAAMPNVRFVPLNWWCNRKSQVVTCVKLKQVQQPVGKHAGSASVIRLSKRIIYDTQEAIVSFLSENVDNCVNEFLEEWAKVSKMVVIAREVAQMSRVQSWADVKLLSFDLQKVEFVYFEDYTVSITCVEQILATENRSTYELSFSRVKRRKRTSLMGPPYVSDGDDLENPHVEAQDFLKRVLRHGPQLSASLKQLVGILRDTLPLARVVENLKDNAEKEAVEAPHQLMIDAFPKGAGWYRVTYGDARYALDLRSMTSRKVAILDASISFTNPVTALRARSRPPPSKGKGKAGKALASVREGQESATSALQPVGVLRPIPNFATLLLDVIRDVIGSSVASDSSGRNCARAVLATMGVIPIDSGIICNVDSVAQLVPLVHRRILTEISRSEVNEVSGTLIPMRLLANK